MRKIRAILFCIFAALSFIHAQNTPISIIPKPLKLNTVAGNFIITSKTIIYIGVPEAQPIADLLASRLKMDGTSVSIQDINKAKTDRNVIFFLKTDDKALGTEGYQLSVTGQQINIRANTERGMFYAVQSLMQLLPPDIYSASKIGKKGGWKVPCVEIEDNPRYVHRGLMLDAGRHFFSVSFVKKFIDLLAVHKMNTFHWHLTEDQGWRIEIKKYPKLTQIGSIRKETLVGHYSEQPQKFDGTPYGGFYTQEDIKDVVAYAKARYIDVIPEIEMPGHATAAIASYPELGCDSTKKYEVGTKWGVQKDVFCPSEKTFSFLEDVLTEVIALFPYKYIHIGGDECPKDAWKASAFCQNLIKEKGLKDEHELQSYFIQRIEKFVNSKGRSIIGWDEILEGGLAPNATVMSWRGISGGIAAAKENHNVIMSPGSHCYLDYYQADPATEPLAIGSFLTLEKAYSYDPTPTELTEEQAKYILGVQGNIWTEYISTGDYFEYMAFPRGIALAEVAWSNKVGRDYNEFTKRLIAHSKRLDYLKVNYAKRFLDVKMELKAEGSTPSVFLTSLIPNADIRYTTNGLDPKANSTLYTKPFSINSITTVSSAVFQNGTMISKPVRQTFYGSSALGRPYTFAIKPSNTYESGAMGLTNGVRGITKNYAQWVGFNGNDMEVIFDFNEPRAFSNVCLQFLNRPESYIFLPDYAIVSVSTDGKEWTDINRSDFAHLRDLNKTFIKEAKLPFSDYTKPKRFLKIFAKNVGKVPDGHAAAGKAAWLFADEILID